jgi:hypothetical protein
MKPLKQGLVLDDLSQPMARKIRNQHGSQEYLRVEESVE